MDDGYFHGINKMKKPGFKVIKPPGGQTQINIFEQNQEIKSGPINPCQAERNSSNVFAHQGSTPVKSNADRNASSIVFAGPELSSSQPAPAPAPVAAAAPAPAPAPAKPAAQPKATNTNISAPAAPPAQASAPPPPAANTPAKPTNNSVQCTPENANRTVGNPPPQRSSTKVIAPPGGRSSINLFG